MTWTNSVSLAVACHLAALLLLTISFRGMPRDYQMEFFFWGDIVRKEELSPGRVRSLGEPESPNVDLSKKGRGVFSLWSKGLVDKPDVKNAAGDAGLPDPIKFSGPRVTWNEEADRTPVVEFDEPPAVKLRYPRP